MRQSKVIWCGSDLVQVKCEESNSATPDMSQNHAVDDTRTLQQPEELNKLLTTTQKDERDTMMVGQNKKLENHDMKLKTEPIDQLQEEPLKALPDLGQGAVAPETICKFESLAEMEHHGFRVEIDASMKTGNPEEYEVIDLSASETESDADADGEYLPGNNESSVGKSTAADHKPKKPRRPPAKNAREFVARLHHREDEKIAREQLRTVKKRKSGETTISSYAVKKPRQVNVQEVSIVAQLEQELAGENNNNQGESLAPAMPAATAHTHGQQFAILKKSIPEGSDTRRVKTQQRDEKEAVKLFGYKKVKAANLKWLLDGMTTSLEGYQLTATAWMVKRELARVSPFGGILADDMGMGKTLMSLACVVGNPPDASDLKKFIRTTLVIVPNFSVAQQWLRETKKHVGTNISDYVVIFDRRNQMTAGQMGNEWIIIATIQEVRKQFVLWSESGASQRVDRSSKKATADMLFRVQWYRVILDEAHAIKNTFSQSRAACCALIAKHCWALSGTPLSNSTEEILPYLNFIGCGIDEDIHEFSKTYLREGKANDKLEALISMVMYRRTKKDTWLGHKILDIPPCHTHDITISLSQEETILYEFTKSIFLNLSARIEQKKNEQIERANECEVADLEKKLRKELQDLHVEQYVHLRMTVSHAFNLEFLLRTKPLEGEFDTARQNLQRVDEQKTILDQLLSDNTVAASMKQYASGVSFLKKHTDPALGGIFRFESLLDLLQNDRKAQEKACTSCQITEPTLPVSVTECGHVYCSNCYCVELQKQIFPTDGQSRVITCVSEGCPARLVVSQTISTAADVASKDSKFRELGVDSNNVTLLRPKERNGCFVVADYLPEVSPVPSSRLTVAMTVLSSWTLDFPDDKILVFTQFILTAKVLGRMLQVADMPFLYYFGCMSAEKKAQALDLFREDPKQRIMVVSLIAGGQSLNITSANRMILIDPWWNQTAEQQAIGRAHRMGQTKHCYVVRIFTTADMDDKILNLQKKKTEKVSHALQDDGHIPQSLDDEQRKELFDFTHGETKPKPKTTKQKPKWRGGRERVGNTRWTDRNN